MHAARESSRRCAPGQVRSRGKANSGEIRPWGNPTPGKTDPGEKREESVPDRPATVALFDRTYEEALSLTEAARDYVAHQQRRDRDKLSGRAQLAASCESMRLTARMTQIMAWLLMQRAVHSGEISREEAAEQQWRLSGQRVCRQAEPYGGVRRADLPKRLNELLAQSLSLYERIARLDDLLDG